MPLPPACTSQAGPLPLACTVSCLKLGSWQALLLRYHPDNEQDQPSPAGEAVLALPPLQDQYLLEERIQAVLDLSDKVF